VTDAKIWDLTTYETSEQYSPAERAALAWADAMTDSQLDTSDALYLSLREHFSEAAIVELTALVAFENFRSKFNHAMRVAPIGQWQPGSGQGGVAQSR